jgi:hypothetical protein
LEVLGCKCIQRIDLDPDEAGVVVLAEETRNELKALENVAAGEVSNRFKGSGEKKMIFGHGVELKATTVEWHGCDVTRSRAGSDIVANQRFQPRFYSFECEKSRKKVRIPGPGKTNTQSLLAAPSSVTH